MQRPDLHVLARFLAALARPGTSWTRARLQPAVRLNYDLFRRYLEFMAARGWIEEMAADDEPSPHLRLTPTGQAAHRELLAWLARWLDDAPG